MVHFGFFNDFLVIAWRLEPWKPDSRPWIIWQIEVSIGDEVFYVYVCMREIMIHWLDDSILLLLVPQIYFSSPDLKRLPSKIRLRESTRCGIPNLPESVVWWGVICMDAFVSSFEVSFEVSSFEASELGFDQKSARIFRCHVMQPLLAWRLL
jgi:hypothetical protein